MAMVLPFLRVLRRRRLKTMLTRILSLAEANSIQLFVLTLAVSPYDFLAI